MTASMTAFHRLQENFPAGRLVWEIRSLNHRYLDIHLKLPDHLRRVEPVCREQIVATLSRGRLDATLSYEPCSDPNHPIRVNVPAAKSLARGLETMTSIIPNPGRVDLIAFLRWPGVLEPPKPDVDHLATSAEILFTQALEGLVQVRHREGARLESLIRERIQSAQVVIQHVKDALPEIEDALKVRWGRRLAELDREPDPVRIAQEQAIFLSRTDISEELDRLEAHLTEVARVLDQKEPSGRRLDFLMQELHREANTLGAKSNALGNTQAAIELKLLIEQMREQIQNIE